MKKYQIQYTTQSAEDMETVFEFIARECFAPLTAKRYMEGIKKEIDRLEVSAGSIAIDEVLSREYGLEVRRTHYKKVAIIFSVEEKTAYIHHIIPQKMIIFPINLEEN